MSIAMDAVQNNPKLCWNCEREQTPILSDFRGAHAPSRAVSGALAGNIFATTLHRLGDGLRM